MPRHAPRRTRRALPRRWRVAGLLSALVLAVNAAVLAGGWVSRDDGAGAAPGVELAVGPQSAPTDDPVTGFDFEVPLPFEVDAAASLPVPQPPPADPYAATPEARHGQLEIPAIGLSQPLFGGVTLTAINRGPSHWPGTAMPGEMGNVVVAGHRTTYTRPFWALDELQPGDELIFTIGEERTVYELDRLEIVSPEDVHIIDQRHDFQATLFACHPRGSARQRIVGHFRMKPDTLSVEMTDRWWALSPFRAL